LGLPEPVGRILEARGIGDAPTAKAHLRPLLSSLHSPQSLRDLDVAADRLTRAISGGETILVHGDYDVDGIAAAALLTRSLRRLGARVEAFVPHRLRDGYDLGEAGLARAAQVGATVLLTADCGIVAHEAVARAGDLGLDVIVTDHHTPSDALPDALAVVNPNRADCDYPEGVLCGAGVAFKLVQRLLELRGRSLEDLLPDLDLVALATVADLVPLTGENRVLVRYGLRALARTTKVGLRALMKVAEVEGDAVDAGQVGFRLAPRINALGRLDDAAVALQLLLTDDADEARRLAAHADQVNAARQEEDRRTLDEALRRLEVDYLDGRDFSVVMAGDGWHPGVIGIVASRIVERIHRPVILIALREGRGRGSGRSVPGFDLHGALVACSSHLDRFGGHKQAAGLDLDPIHLEAFREAFNAVARERLDGVDLRPEVRADIELHLGSTDLALADVLRHLGPHGIGNPRPVFFARGLRVVGSPREVGRGHLKLTLEQDGVSRPAIGFGLVDRWPPEALVGERVDALFQLTVNDYRGRRTAQLRLRDLRIAERG
jgi:single-stranded-DNA-specific exonuclease